jgi:molybdate transport system ATP-binding protein
MRPLLDLALQHAAGEFNLDVSLTCDAGPLVIIGPSGAGKTLVLRSIAGILLPDSGRIAVGERLLFDRSKGIDVPVQDRRVGYVPQEYALFPHLTVEGNIAFGFRGGPGQKQARVDEMLDLVGLGAHRKDRPNGLSGGERQRVALARALAVQPDLLLLDEPFSALDAPTRESLLNDVRVLIAATNTPTIIVTHDRNEALRLGERIAVLMEGRARQIGTPAEVFTAPADDEVASFVGVETILPGRVVELSGGVPVVQVGDRRVEGGTAAEAGSDVLVCLRPEDVVLSAPAPDLARTSVRNRLPARVTAMAPAGPFVRVELDAGFRIVSLITRHAVDDLSLAPGAEVTATFKATAVHLIPKGQTC